MNLIRIGFYKEMSHAEKTDPSIFDHLHSPFTEKEKALICSYLQRGEVLVACCGFSNDIVNPEKGVAGVPSILTDGTFVWPGDLAYYVNHYNLSLPSAFIQHMMQNNWTPMIDSEKLFETDISFVDLKQ